MKKLVPSLITIGFLALAAVALAATFRFSSAYLSAHSSATPTPITAACETKGQNHTATIADNTIAPALTKASLCDTLTIINDDEATKLIAFGQHDDHVPYDGVSEKALIKGQSLTVTLNQAGMFHFHDHIQDIAQADFTVTNSK